MSNSHEIIDRHTGEILSIKLKPLSSPLLNSTNQYEHLLKCHDRRGMLPCKSILAQHEKECLYVTTNRLIREKMISKPDKAKLESLCKAIKVKNVLITTVEEFEIDILGCGKNNIQRSLKNLIAQRYIHLETHKSNPKIRQGEIKLTINPNCYFVRPEGGSVPLSAISDFYKLAFTGHNYEYTNF